MPEHVPDIKDTTVPMGAGQEMVEISGAQAAMLLATIIHKHFDHRLSLDNLNRLADRLIESGAMWAEGRLADPTPEQRRQANEDFAIDHPSSGET